MSSLAESVQSQLSSLRTFLDPELSFSSAPAFRKSFCKEVRRQEQGHSSSLPAQVRDSVLVCHLQLVISTSSQFSSPGPASVPPALLLLLSRTCRDLHTSTTQHLASSLQEQFPGQAADLAAVEEQLAAASQALLAGYVKAQAADLSLMLRKSVEARDWLSTVEPRSVRAVMKRVVEDVTLVDEQVGQLYEEGQRKVRSSDSSRNYGARSR